MTIMTTTFVPCGAKLPIIALIAGAFFNNAGWVAWSAYFVGVAAIICSGIILKKTKMFSGEPAPFVMELPAYHMPTVLIAKENVVATFGMLFGFAEVAEDGSEIWGNLAQVMTPIAAYGFLVFNLLCAPCFAAMGAIKREMNNAKWFWFAIGYQCGLAYIVSLCIYQFGTLFTGGGFGLWTVVAVVLLIAFLYMLFRPYKESKSLKVA